MIIKQNNIEALKKTEEKAAKYARRRHAGQLKSTKLNKTNQTQITNKQSLNKLFYSAPKS